MLIKSIKKRCEEIASGNNGRIRPEGITVRGDLVNQLQGEIEKGNFNRFSVSFSPHYEWKNIRMEWNGFEWSSHVDGIEEEKEYTLKFNIHVNFDTNDDSFRIKNIHCHKCDNKPFQDSEGNYYCPVCVQ